MAIKNWFVRSERLHSKSSGLITYGSYLIDKEHKNHKGKTTAIHDIYGNVTNFIQTSAREAIELDLKNAQGKGGRPVDSYAQSFVLTLPDGVHKPSREQWKAITKDVLIDAFKKLNKTPEEMRGHFFANVHDQKNPHLNILISKVVDGQSLRAVNQVGIIGAMKKSFNASVLKHCGIDYKDYEPLKTNVGKSLPRWQLEQQNKINEKLSELDIKETVLDTRINDLKKLNKLSHMLNNQLIKWMHAVKTSDIKDVSRQENRIKKTVEELSGLNISDEQMTQFNELFDLAEEETSHKIPVRVAKNSSLKFDFFE